MDDVSRDTAVVVQELFREAKESILVASFALDEGSKAEALFGPVAARMDAEPALKVTLFVNVHCKYRNETPGTILLREFADNFRKNIGPGDRLPEVFYDPPSSPIRTSERACTPSVSYRRGQNPDDLSQLHRSCP